MSTLKIAHLADLHCDERRDLADWKRVTDAFIADARSKKIDLILIAGDFFERKSTPAERNVMADFLLEAAEQVAPIYGVRGNHDADGDLEIFNRLDAESFVEILERPTAGPKSARLYSPGVPRMADYHLGSRIAILALPWFTKTNIAASLPADTPASETTERTIQAARQLLHLIRAEAHRCRREGMIPILLGHVMVAGSETSTGQTLIGQTVELSPGDLRDTGCEYIALGHVHKAQSWYDGRVAYAGSPRATNFGEPEAKGWNLVTIEDGRWTGTEFVELPARRIVLLEEDWASDPETLRAVGIPQLEIDEEVEGAMVRLRYRVLAQDLHLIDDDALARELMGNGAESVQVEPQIVHESQARCAEVADARTVWKKILAYWQARGVEMEHEQAHRLETKVAGLEEPEAVKVDHAAA